MKVFCLNPQYMCVRMSVYVCVCVYTYISVCDLSRLFRTELPVYLHIWFIYNGVDLYRASHAIDGEHDATKSPNFPCQIWIHSLFFFPPKLVSLLFNL